MDYLNQASTFYTYVKDYDLATINLGLIASVAIKILIIWIICGILQKLGVFGDKVLLAIRGIIGSYLFAEIVLNHIQTLTIDSTTIISILAVLLLAAAIDYFLSRKITRMKRAPAQMIARTYNLRDTPSRRRRADEEASRSPTPTPTSPTLPTPKKAPRKRAQVVGRSGVAYLVAVLAGL
jgi:hypothetical protein